jgi:hypothetical protein
MKSGRGLLNRVKEKFRVPGSGFRVEEEDPLTPGGGIREFEYDHTPLSGAVCIKIV